MPIHVLPTLDAKQLPKPSKGDFFGALWQTRNIDLTIKPGAIKLAEGLGTLMTSVTDGDFEVPTALIRSNADTTDRWWCLVQTNGIARDGVLFKSSGEASFGVSTQDTGTNTPTDACDNMEIFGEANGEDRLVVARDTDLAMLNNGTTWDHDWWTNTLSQSALSASNPHYVHNFLNLLLVPDGNVLHTIDDSLVVVTERITLPDEYQILWIKNDGRFAYIAARHKKGGEGLIFPWNGTTVQYDDPLHVGSNWPLAGAIDENNLLHIMNDAGELLQITGSGFTKLAELPFRYAHSRWYTDRTDGDLGKWNHAIVPNGMDFIDSEKLQMCVATNRGSSGTETAPLPNFQGGIWEYTPDTGLYCKHGFSGNGSDVGAGSINASGLLKGVKHLSGQTYTIAGASVPTNATPSTREGLFNTLGVSTPATNRGYFVTAKLENPSAVRSFWKRIHLAFRGFERSTDRIVVKYRTEQVRQFMHSAAGDSVGGAYFNGTWSDTGGDTFTSTDDLSNIQIGDEIEILYGEFAGMLAHVSSISESGGTYTVVLDESIGTTTSSATFRMRVQRFTKLNTISDQALVKKLMTIAKRSSWIQFKVELRGSETSPELEKLLIESGLSAR